MRLVLFNKPYGVLSQFTDAEGRPTLADHLALPGFRPAGRLDLDSEGLLLLTDDGRLQTRIADPRHKLPKTYWAQVEGHPSPEHLAALARGVVLNDGPTLPARARALPEAPAGLWVREPPIRYRAAIPTGWIELTLREGRNRQVRRMTAAVGLPTLRLVRWSVGPWTVAGLAPGQWREVDPAEIAAILPPLPGGAPHERLETPRHRRQPGRGGRPVSAGGRGDRRPAGDQPAGRAPGSGRKPHRRGKP